MNTNDSQAAIDSILTNDEVSTDEELMAHFVNEMGLTTQEAESQVARRNQMLNKI
jgi:arginine repressor